MELAVIQPPTRACAECGGGLIGRADMKFCGDMCRSNYNNRLRMEAAKQTPAYIHDIQKALVTNHKILSKLWAWGRQVVSKHTLAEMGFNFALLTSFREESGVLCRYCFDIGYVTIGEEVLLLQNSELAV